MDTTTPFPKPFPFYSTVKDKTSGFTGSLAYYQYELDGTVRIAIQPACDPEKPGVLPDAMLVDALICEQAAPPKEGLNLPAPVPTDIELGDEVQDVVSGILGVAVVRQDSSNGCVHFYIQPRATKKDIKKGYRPPPKSVSALQLQIVDKGVVDVTPVATDKPGPVSQRLSRQKA